MVEGESKVKIEPNLTEIQTKNLAREEARKKAIQNAFGSTTISGSSVFIRNTVTGQKVKSQEEFSIIANTIPNGTWVEKINEKFEKVQEGNETWIICKTKGRAQEYSLPPIQFEVYTADCSEKRCKEQNFLEGESLHLYFRSAVSGYLSVFIYEAGKVFRLLPYKKMTGNYESNCYINGDKEYFFFSRANGHDYFNNRNIIDRLELFTEEGSDRDLSRLYIVFSPKFYDKPILDDCRVDLTPEEKKDGYDIPPCLTIDEFMKWLHLLMKKQRVQLSFVDYTVTKE